MTISRDELKKMIERHYKKQHGRLSPQKITCAFCGKVIPKGVDVSKIEYVKTKRGTAFYFHKKCV